MKTIDTPHGVLPVIDTWKKCRHTKTGWTGVNEEGQRVNISYRPEERDFGPARMPDLHYVILTRDAAADALFAARSHPRRKRGLVLV